MVHNISDKREQIWEIFEQTGVGYGCGDPVLSSTIDKCYATAQWFTIITKKKIT